MLPELLVPLGLLIVVAKLFEGALGRLGLNSIIAYVLTGILLGPVLNWVTPNDELQLFLGLGIFVLFFNIGFDEIDVRGFVSIIGGRYFAAAIISVAISTTVALSVTSDIFGLSFSLNLPITDALALAGVLSLSSLGLVAKVLSDSGQLRESIGLRIFAVVLIAEVMTLLVVGFTVGEHAQTADAAAAVGLIAQIVGFVLVAWLLSTRVLPTAIALLQRIFNVPQLSFGLLLGGLFLMVVGAERMGLHGTIGALLFGAALSGLPEQVRGDIMPGLRSASEGLFVPLFFASAGLHFDLSFLDLPASTIAALVIIPLAGKFAGAFIGAYLVRIDAPLTLATGLMAKGVAEVGFLLVMLEGGVIGADVFSMLVLVMFGYMLLMPPLITASVNHARATGAPATPLCMPPSFARYALAGVQASSLLDATRMFPGPEVPIEEFLENWTVPGHTDYVVVSDGEAVGIVSAARLKRVRRSTRVSTPLHKVMRPCPMEARPDEPISDVLERMAKYAVNVTPVVDGPDGEFRGTIVTHDVIDLLALMDEIRPQPDRVHRGQGSADGTGSVSDPA
ncbi:cation:proton antiporter [Candidatus Poriferisodalis sp.]|uniref:cation:proton antiporter domain-containing protein n=1 Tax=Candidatus Poriferisodalis sp. TaxID=3101277 RepID=UPI003B5184B3